MKLLFSCLLFTCSTCLLAQQKKQTISRDTINLAGYIYDEAGKAVKMMPVKSSQLETDHNSFPLATYTDDKGYFMLKGAKFNDTLTLGPDINYDLPKYYNHNSRYMVIYLPSARVNNINPNAPIVVVQKRRYPKVKPSFTVEPMNDISSSAFVTSPAEYPGGINQFADVIKKTIIYPEAALKHNAEGTVQVEFTINKDGAATDFKIMRGVGYDCDEEVIRAIKHAKKWKPAIDHDRPVATKETVAVEFKLTDN